MVIDEHFVPAHGLDIAPYAAAGDVGAVHHLIRYAWALECLADLPDLTAHGVLDVAWCDVEGGIDAVTVSSPGSLLWGAGNIDADPRFVDADGPDDDPQTLHDNDLRLALRSPCIDAGANASVEPDALDLDGDGNTTEPTPLDLDGAPRFVDVARVPDTGSGTPPLVDLGAWERP